jgi:hypothetical protein
MMRQLMRRAAVAAVPLITLPVLALAAAPGTALASAPSASLQIHGQAQLQPDGSVIVTLDYSCDGGFFGPTGSLEVTVDQPAAAGQIFNIVACDNRKHIVTVDVPDAFGTVPFTRGTAAAAANISNGLGSSFAVTQAELKVM